MWKTDIYDFLFLYLYENLRHRKYDETEEFYGIMVLGMAWCISKPNQTKPNVYFYMHMCIWTVKSSI